MENLCVEIVIRSNRKETQEKLPKDAFNYMNFEADDKIVFSMPSDWSGFKDGSIITMMREFKDMYIALAYFSLDEGEFVTDFENKMIDPYASVWNGKKASKFVKKRLQILKILDPVRDSYTLDRYMIDIKFTNPIIHVMKLYSDASTGGISSKGFLPCGS